MKIKKFIFPFSANSKHLKDKWWHRLFSVLFAVLTTLFVLCAIIVSSEIVNDSSFNSRILNNLRDFSASSDVSVSNTIPNFLNQNAKFGCMLDNGRIDYVSTYSLQNSSFCSADIKSHLPDVAGALIKDQHPDILNNTTQYQSEKDGLIGALTQKLQEDTEKRYCFINNDVSCASSKIVAYKHGVIFYVLIVLYSLIATYIFSVFLQFVYYKGLIYIIYGKRK